MKKIYYKLAFVILCLFVLTNGLFSQFTQFKAKDGLQTALNQAKNDLKDPELFFLGTQTGTINGTVTIDNVFDISKGVSTVWAYMFRSISKPDSQKFYGVAFALGSYIAQSINPALLNGKLPFTPTTAIASQAWIDSDVLSQDITKNTEYKGFLLKNSDAKLQLAGLAVDPDSKSIIWAALISAKNGKLNCITDVTTGTTVCTEQSPVIEPVSTEFMVYPNPVTTSAVISLPSFPINSFRIDLYNIMGEKLSTINSDGNQNATQFILDVNNFPDGLYYISYTSNGKNVVKPMIIKK